ncbi:MAG: endonuclease/exonuclease/phosphatase family protein, partial [Gemmatimonadetes bacterium]|nr:endonuclease/exonuclease/phosphatase family protein [Gemmatimonadota bacterium]
MGIPNVGPHQELVGGTLKKATGAAATLPGRSPAAAVQTAKVHQPCKPTARTWDLLERNLTRSLDSPHGIITSLVDLMKHVGRGWLAALGLIAALGCRPVVNYPSLLGPRYAGGEASMRRGAAPSRIRVVTFNVQFGRHVDRLIELLQLAGSADGADIVTLQEVDPAQTDRLAQALGMAYVYYPAVVHPRSGRDFGNAVLSRWPIVDDRKVILPHHGRFRDSQRAATAATVVVGDDSLRVYSVHLSTMVEVAPSSRREQARTVLADAARLRRVVVGGDLNGVGVGDEFEACGFLWPTKDNAPTH